MVMVLLLMVVLVSSYYCCIRLHNSVMSRSTSGDSYKLDDVG